MKPASPGPFVPLVAGGRLSLAFIAEGLVGLLTAAFVAIRESAAGEPWLAPLHPQGLLAAHLWIPAGLLPLCLGAVYQLTPVVLGKPLRLGTGWLWTHLALHSFFLFQVLFGLATGRWRCMAIGGMGLALGLVIFGAAVLRTFRLSSRRDAAAWSLPLAAGWLGLTFLAGALLAAQKWLGHYWVSPWALLRVHVHLGALGFFVTLLQGVTFQLYPMFTLGEAKRLRAALVGLFGAQVALALFVVGVLRGSRAVELLALVLWAGALGGSLRAFVAMHRSRRRRKLDAPLRAFVVGLGFLPIAGSVGLFLGATDASTPALLSTYGLLVFAGALSLTILGMLGKILPFLVWMRAYGPHVGRRPVPAVTALGWAGAENVWFGLHLAALLLLAVSTFGSGSLWRLAGSACLAAGLVVLSINALLVLSHLFRPRLVPPSLSHATIRTA